MRLLTIDLCADPIGFDFCQPFHDSQIIPEGAGELGKLPEYDEVDFAELIDGTMELAPAPSHIFRDMERNAIAELGPRRFDHVRELLLSVWETDRMI